VLLPLRPPATHSSCRRPRAWQAGTRAARHSAWAGCHCARRSRRSPSGGRPARRAA